MYKELPIVNVSKYNLQGEEVWHYPGQILLQTSHAILLEATFDREEVDVGGLLLRRGDRFVELYLREHWYNIYQIYDGRDQRLKGWYCNITFPPSITPGSIKYVDLALDLLIFPDGRQVTLDRDEFEALNLDCKDHQKANAALEELQKCFRHVDSISLERWASQSGCPDSTEF